MIPEQFLHMPHEKYTASDKQEIPMPFSQTASLTLVEHQWRDHRGAREHPEGLKDHSPKLHNNEQDGVLWTEEEECRSPEKSARTRAKEGHREASTCPVGNPCVQWFQLHTPGSSMAPQASSRGQTLGRGRTRSWTKPTRTPGGGGGGGPCQGGVTV